MIVPPAAFLAEALQYRFQILDVDGFLDVDVLYGFRRRRLGGWPATTLKVTKDMQNAQLRRKVTSSSSAAPMERERRPVPLAGQASPAAERPPINKMQVLSGV